MSFTDTFATPDDLGPLRTSELHASLGESLGAQAAEALDPQSGVSAFQLWRRAKRAIAGNPDFMPALVDAPGAAPPARPDEIPDVAIADAKARVKQEGLEGSLPLPDQPSIKAPVLDLMIDEAHEHRDRELAIARGPHGFSAGALGFATSIGAGMIDPINMAAFSVPVLGEARVGAMMASAGDNLFARAGMRALQGAAQGAAGTAALQPFDWWAHTADGRDYTMADALRSIVLGAGMGAAFHAGIGSIGDVRARIAGRPLNDADAAGARTAQPLGETQLEGQGEARWSSAEEVPGMGSAGEPAHAAPDAGSVFDGLPEAYPPDHPASVLADLPPGAREDVARSAIADLINGRPVRSAELLQEAAKVDPRIRETIEAWHGSPHSFDAFSLDRIGTGEGAEAYGHGLYFAEHPEVAKSYVPLTSGGGQNSAGIRLNEPKGGNIYRVRIHADRSAMLDWDANAREQPEGLKAAFQRAGMDLSGATTGEDAYRQLTTRLGSQRAASRALADAGVPGIRYLDQGSRAFKVQLTYKGKPYDEPLRFDSRSGAEQWAEEQRAKGFGAEVGQGGTRNFVLFSDKGIDITHKNGAPVARGAEVAVPNGKPAKAQSLLEFLLAKGGVSEDDPLAADLLQSFGGQNPNFRGKGKLIRAGGLSLDRLREAAVEARYLADHGEETGGVSQSTVRDLLDAVDQEARGKKQYPRGDELAGTDEDAAHLAERATGEREVFEHQMREEITRLMDQDGVTAIRPQIMNVAMRTLERGTAKDAREALDLALDNFDMLGNRPQIGDADMADWEQFAKARPEHEEPQLVIESKEAAAAPEPASIDATKAPSAAEKAAADADRILEDMRPMLTEEERAQIDELLGQLDRDREERGSIIKEGAACLAAAVA